MQSHKALYNSYLPLSQATTEREAQKHLTMLISNDVKSNREVIFESILYNVYFRM